MCTEYRMYVDTGIEISMYTYIYLCMYACMNVYCMLTYIHTYLHHHLMYIVCVHLSSLIYTWSRDVGFCVVV